MGVYIKGMEMPTSCRACLYSRTDIRNVDWCVLTEKDLPCDCPLVPVPPHGRLIDADALNEAMERMVPWAITDPTVNAFLDGLSEAYEVIQSAPTIIPEEEGET